MNLEKKVTKLGKNGQALQRVVRDDVSENGGVRNFKTRL